MHFGMTWDAAGATVPSGPGRTGVLKNIIDDFNPTYLP